MAELQLLAAWIGGGYLALHRRLRGGGPERGDVPGWVMVTVMTAGLVVVIFGVFKGRITDAINNALNSVTGATGN
jgi:hypothetical protein